MRSGSHKRKNDAGDSSFLGTRGRGNHNKKNKGHGCGRRHGGRGRCDNTLQTHDNANPSKDKSMIKYYSYEKIWALCSRVPQQEA